LARISRDFIFFLFRIDCSSVSTASTTTKSEKLTRRRTKRIIIIDTPSRGNKKYMQAYSARKKKRGSNMAAAMSGQCINTRFRNLHFEIYDTHWRVGDFYLLRQAAYRESYKECPRRSYKHIQQVLVPWQGFIFLFF